LNGTTLFYKEFRFERNARFDYKFVMNGNPNWVLDPLNPRTFPGGFGLNSQMWMPDFVPPPEARNDTGIAHGTQETFSITSNILGNTRTVTVYLPPAFGDTARSYPVMYCHDGNDYRNFLRIMTIADNMIAAQRVPPFMIVMVPPVNRSGEYHMNPLFARFFTEELIPRIDSVYTTLPTRAGRLIIGDSSAGLGALYLAWHKSEYFRYCIPQSGYFSWNGDAIIDSMSANPARDVKIYMNVGTYEAAIGGDINLYAAQQRLEQVLITKGYEHRAVYLPDGHSWANWQRVIPEALEWMWGE
jgi:enterochelin esterase family protein